MYFQFFKELLQKGLKYGKNRERFKIEQKGMIFDHDFGYSFSIFSSLLKKEGREKENEVVKNVPFCSTKI